MKRKKETITAGIIALIISQILIKIIGLAYKLYLTNEEGFGDKGNAIYSSGFQIYALLLTFSSIGVPNAISKLVSERLAVGDSKGAHKIFKIAFFTFALLGLFGTMLLFILAKKIAYVWLEIPEAVYSLIALSPSIFFVSITSVVRGYFNGMQTLSLTAKSQTIEQVLKTVFTIVLVEIVSIITKKNTALMAGVANLATTIATILSFIYIYYCYRKKRKEISQEIISSVNYVPTRIRKTLKKILKESIPISLTSLMSSFNKNIDLFTVVKKLKKTMDESFAKKQYGILSGKIDTLCVLPISLNIPFVTSMISEISRLNAKNEKEKLKIKVEEYIKISLIIGIPSTFGMYIFSNEILKLLFPNAIEGATLLKVNSISILFSILTQTINGVLQGIGKSKVPIFSFSIAMMLKLITNIMTIANPNIGILGAVYGNIIFNTIAYTISYIIVKKKIKITLAKIFLKITFITFLTLILSKILFINLKSIFFEKMATIVVISIATIIYFSFLSVFKIIKIKKNKKFY